MHTCNIDNNVETSAGYMHSKNGLFMGGGLSFMRGQNNYGTYYSDIANQVVF